MAELAFLRDAGAVAFTDADHAVADPQVLRRCLTYARALGALVVTHAQEPVFSAAGCATEGQFASQLGLPGVPAEAEAIQLARDLALAKLTGARLHADQITTAEALEALARAKDAGLPVSAGIAATHLVFNEFDIADYKTFFKLAPPLRSEADREAVEQAVADGLIDVIVSNHRPRGQESKRLPFEAASAGAVGLETLLPTALNLWREDRISLPTLWERISLTPARLMGLDAGRLSPGAPADLVLLDANAPWMLDRAKLRSKAKSSPFDRRRLQGYALKTWVGGRLVYDRAGDQGA
jgi:dihydroorotase